MSNYVAKGFTPANFEASEHYYPKVLNAQLHPQVLHFLAMSNDRIAERYSHLHPEVMKSAIESALAEIPRHFRWGGADLFHVTTQRGRRQVVVIETNSSPSGQKSMPVREEQEQGGYRQLLERAFLARLSQRSALRGDLAVLYDKNLMECSGYAATLADLTGESVWLVPCFDGDPEPLHRFNEEGVLSIQTPTGEWVQIRGALRYVTQRPWNRIPVTTRTLLFNPVLICLAGGRNKLLAAKAYDFYNAELRPTGLAIRTPETIWDVSLNEVPLWVQRMGGVAVVKNPYSNAGQGVYTITTEAELEAFMSADHHYGQFIVQSLIGNASWSSESIAGRFYHVGTMPNRKCQIHVADLRMMVGVGKEGFFPVAIYARRAREALAKKIDGGTSSWGMLGTNLSVKRSDGSWDSESNRLMLMDSRDFNRLGLGADELIEAYIQTVLSVTAIDRMACQLITKKGVFRRKFFASLNNDDALLEEISQ